MPLAQSRAHSVSQAIAADLEPPPYRPGDPTFAMCDLLGAHPFEVVQQERRSKGLVQVAELLADDLQQLGTNELLFEVAAVLNALGGLTLPSQAASLTTSLT